MDSPQMPRYRPGQQVRLCSRPDRVGHVTETPLPVMLAGEYWYTVNFGPGRTARHPESDLDPYQGQSDSVAAILQGGQFGGREAFSKLVTHLKLSVSFRSQIYALAASRTKFYPYQFKPLLKFLDSRTHRLLIADEVGLGKTIESGIILTELRNRRPMKRVLIVPPSHLVPKWHDEMRRRFDLEFHILDTRDALDFLRRFEEEGDETELHGILSLQSLRGKRLQERWEEVSPALDLVVFDEAGRLRNEETRSHATAKRLVETADGVLLLTATPVQTGNTDLFNLLRLLEPEEFASLDVFQERLRANEPVLRTLRLLVAGNDLKACAQALESAEKTPMGSRFLKNAMYHDVLTRLREAVKPDRHILIELQRDLNSLNVLGHVLSRTRKREVSEDQPRRRAVLQTIEPGPAELDFYTKVTKLCRDAYADIRDRTLAAFATMMPQRQVASCMVAMVDYCLERLGLPGPTEFNEVSDLDLEDFDLDSDAPSDSLIDWSALGDLRQWRRRLYEQDSKWEKLLQVLQLLEAEEPGAKVVVFAFFKKTLAYLEERLEKMGVRCVRVDGDVPMASDDPDRDERGKRIQQFRDDPTVRVLLSSEVGDEGIDLQFAHVLVNYDLPWNPMRVEQRIGRLDRIGQESKTVTIVNLSMCGTIEDRILQRLYLRIEIFKRSIGDLEAILGEEIRKLERALFSQKLTPEEEEQKIEQVAQVLERQQQDLERFESVAEALIGHDEFFLDEISRARTRGRYLGGPELLIYLKDFLQAHYRTCTLREEPSAGLYTLRVTPELHQFVRDSVPSSDLGLRLFLQRSSSGEVRLTIDSELAQANQRVEFLTFHHPLIRAVNCYYDEHPTELHPVSYVRVHSSTIPPETYIWFLYVTEITGARPAKDLEVVAFPSGSDSPLSADECEDLLSLMIREAASVPPARRSAKVSEALCIRADEVLALRLEERFRERERSNDALVSNRLASIQESFERNVRIRRERIEQARARRRKESYIRGLETGLRNLEHAHREKVQEIEATRALGRSFLLRGAGVVEVLHQGRSERNVQEDLGLANADSRITKAGQV